MMILSQIEREEWMRERWQLDYSIREVAGGWQASIEGRDIDRVSQTYGNAVQAVWTEHLDRTIPNGEHVFGMDAESIEALAIKLGLASLLPQDDTRARKARDVVLGIYCL